MSYTIHIWDSKTRVLKLVLSKDLVRSNTFDILPISVDLIEIAGTFTLQFVQKKKDSKHLIFKKNIYKKKPTSEI